MSGRPWLIGCLQVAIRRTPRRRFFWKRRVSRHRKPATALQLLPACETATDTHLVSVSLKGAATASLVWLGSLRATRAAGGAMRVAASFTGLRCACMLQSGCWACMLVMVVVCRCWAGGVERVELRDSTAPTRRWCGQQSDEST